MKFGEYLEQKKRAEWRPQYLDYKWACPGIAFL